MILFKYLFLILYYSIAQYLPKGYTPIVGKPSRFIRSNICRFIFKRCGKNINVERKAYFGNGFNVEIGDYSGIGVNCHIPNDTKIGNYVMMAENCFIIGSNHNFDRINIPMLKQGSNKKTTVIGNDVWIGRNVLMTPGRIISDGSIIAAGTVLTKDFPSYSIIGGNPSKLIKSRLQNFGDND